MTCQNQEGIAEGYLSACEQENRELRVEVERLRVENDERAREVERVLAKLKDVAAQCEQWQQAFDRALADSAFLRAEIERLKVALREIVKVTPSLPFEDGSSAHEIAREALGEE
jgi:chromosome segregation ATPase